MRNILYIIAFSIMMSCCVQKDYTKLPPYTKDGRRINNTNDTIYFFSEYWHERDYIAPGDTEYNPPKEGYPDTITVAFTRNGKFEDSIEVVRYPGWDFGLKYVYILRCAVGDVFFYTREGKFLHSACAPEPHSGKGTYEHEHYKP